MEMEARGEARPPEGGPKKGLCREAYCARCRCRRSYSKLKISHSFHFILTVLTAGIWSIWWLTIVIGRAMRPWRCETCGWHKPEHRGPLEATVRRGNEAVAKRSRNSRTRISLHFTPYVYNRSKNVSDNTTPRI